MAQQTQKFFMVNVRHDGAFWVQLVELGKSAATVEGEQLTAVLASMYEGLHNGLERSQITHDGMRISASASAWAHAEELVAADQPLAGSVTKAKGPTSKAVMVIHSESGFAARRVLSSGQLMACDAAEAERVIASIRADALGNEVCFWGSNPDRPGCFAVEYLAERPSEESLMDTLDVITTAHGMRVLVMRRGAKRVAVSMAALDVIGDTIKLNFQRVLATPAAQALIAANRAPAEVSI